MTSGDRIHRARRRYPWRRFWYPSESVVHVDESGFLFDPFDPDHAIARHFNPGVRRLEDLKSAPFLVLLGEPGMGKSHEIEAHEAWLRSQGKQVHRVNLGHSTGEQRFIQRIFEGDELRSWLNSRADIPFYLLLDALDEGLDNLNTLDHLIVEELEARTHADVRHLLRLRITCRVGRWPSSMTAALRKLWPATDDSTRGEPELQLAPLTSRDVRTAGETRGLDADEFLAAVAASGAGPLAAKPVTLDMLLDLFEQHDELPTSLIETYEMGCRALCEESNQDRRERYDKRTRLDPGELFELATQVAAAMLFSNRRFIDLGDSKVPGEEAARPEELIVQTTNNPSFRERDVEELVKFTGLFTGAGSDRMTWAHQTYGEFLAARYIRSNTVEPRKALTLLRPPEPREAVVVPALHGVAAWLAGELKIFDALVEHEPDLLLKSDLATFDDARKARLVEALLTRTESGELHPSWQVDSRQYRRLAHDGLADQIRPFLIGRGYEYGSRITAIRLAFACKVRGLADELHDLALDSAEEIPFRVSAISALAEIGDQEHLSALRPLIPSNGADSDEHDVGREVAEALWPELLATDELFDLFERAENDGELGRYQSLLGGLGPMIRVNDLPSALDWIGSRDRRIPGSTDYGESKLTTEVLGVAWENLEEPGVVDALAAATVRMTENYRRLNDSDDLTRFRQQYSEDTGKRQRFLGALAARTPAHLAPRLFPAPWGRLVFAEDCPRLVEKLVQAESTEEKAVLAGLIANCFDPRDQHAFETVFSAAQAVPVLAERLRRHIGPIELDSAEADFHRSNWQARTDGSGQHVDEKQEIAPDESGGPTLSEVIDDLLSRVEAGEAEHWWWISYILGFGESGQRGVAEYKLDQRESPGWREADSRRRERLLAAARKYLLEADPHTELWIKEPRRNRRSLGAYRALRLLLTEEPASFDDLPPEVWQRWAQAVLHLLRDDEGEIEVRQALFCRVREHASATAYSTLKREVRKAVEENILPLPFVQEAAGCLDDKLAEVLLEVGKASMPGRARRRLLGFLIAQEWTPAWDWVVARIRSLSNSSQDWTSEHLDTASVLVLYGGKEGWEVVWELHQRRPGACRDLWLSVVEEEEIGRIFTLPPEMLAALYLWLEEQIDWNELPERKSGEVFTKGALEQLGDFRWGIIRSLETAGTSDAVTALRMIVARSSKPDELRWHVLEAERKLVEQTYPWPTPSEVLELLAGSNRARLVRTGEELLSVLLEAIDRLDVKLHGETPAIRDIWDKQKSSAGESWEPLEEEGLSDYLKRFLDYDLSRSRVIVNREVQVSRRFGAEGAPGQRTDIHVDVAVPGSGEAVTAVIEVKGCWHPEVMTAMRSQLVERYLAEKSYRHGLYLVVWCHCPQWKSARNRNCKHGADRSVFSEKLDGQSRELSAGRAVVVRAKVLNGALPSASKGSTVR